MTQQNFPQCSDPANFSALAWMLKTAAEDISYYAEYENWSVKTPVTEWDFAFAALLALAKEGYTDEETARLERAH